VAGRRNSRSRQPWSRSSLASKLGNSEALVVKKNISKPEDLIGKRIAVPFISTTHYSLLAALKHWGLNPVRWRL
jgi:ABC-type taurine transport system substrate-binding protein